MKKTSACKKKIRTKLSMEKDYKNTSIIEKMLYIYHKHTFLTSTKKLSVLLSIDSKPVAYMINK